MNINVSCEVCNDDLEIVREWSERGDIEITVNPCEYCRHKSRPTHVAADVCPKTRDGKHRLLHGK